MSRLSMVKSLVLVLLSLVVLGGCGGSGGVDSEHDLVPAPETHVTDTNTTPDTNGTQPDDSNGTTGGGSDDGNTTDVTPPVITLNGEANMTLEQNATYTEPGAVAVDAVDGRVPVSISGIVDTATVGHYVVTYRATDHAGNEANAMRSITVVDTVIDVTPPVITLNGEANMTLEQNATYTEPGAVAVDTVDGNVPVSISGSVDTSTVGHYVVTYSATDHAGNQAHATRHIKIINSALTLTSLGLESNITTLNKDHNTTLTLTATYEDNTTKPLTGGITWIITPQEAVTLHGTTLTALKDTNVTVQAKVNNVLSNKIKLNIYWEVNGHRLPPEPDPAINNATLLGVDVNHNGIRDDAERWIILHYAKDPKYPKTKTAIALQYAWASQKILENPVLESKKYLDDALDCQYYWAWKRTQKDTKGKSNFEAGKYYSKLLFLTDPILKDKIYNTRARIEQKFRFNAALSGNIFDGRDESIANCRTNIDKLGE